MESNSDYYRIFRSGDEDEEELIHDNSRRAFKSCHKLIASEVISHFDKFLNHLKSLSNDDKEMIMYAYEKRGCESAVKETMELLAGKDEFCQDLISALEKCSLNEVSSTFKTTLEDEELKAKEYAKRYEEYKETHDDTLLKHSAGPNQGYRRTEIKPRQLVPRKYQSELAAKAMEGKNCLVCAPTNSGKTFVSIMIAQRHIDDAKVTTPRVLLLVPRFALLQQIYRQYKEFLPLLGIGKKSGSSPARTELKNLLCADEVVIATAAILQNALQDGSVKFSDFTLLIFDECHHAIKDHAYNKIMMMYIRQKNAAPLDAFPQVVGLTASPGAGQVISATMAKEWILKLCANLDSRHFVMVREHVAELNEFTNEPKRSTIAAGNRQPNPFEHNIVEYMNQVEQLIEFRSPVERSAQEYINHMQTVKMRFVAMGRHDAIFYCEHLCKIQEALCLAIEVRLEDSFKFLCEIRDKIVNYTGDLYKYEENVKHFCEDLINRLQPYKQWELEYPNPKLAHVKKIIMDSKKECDDDLEKKKEFRAMIYTKTRQMTLAIYNWMQADPDLSSLKTKYLTGIHASVDEGGLTAESTKAILAEFEKGDVKVLVCTTVGEEGLNIGACRLIIRYNHVTNEISMIQARGRIREKEGNEVVIGEHRVLAKDKTNVLLEEVMRVAMIAIMDMNTSEFLQEIHYYQRESIEKIKEREMQSLLSQNMQSSDQDAECILCCSRCGWIACPLSEIRRACSSNYINPQTEFRKKVKFRDDENPRKRQEGIQKIHCAKCDYDWGNTFNRFPCLKISAFILESPNGYRKTTKQWKKVLYDVPLLTNKD